MAKPNVGTGLSDEQLRRLKQVAKDDASDKAAEASVNGAKPRAAAVPKEPKQCGCGCGDTTKGGRFIPGHDARFHSRVKELERQGVAHEQAETIAAKGPLTGKYLQAQEKNQAAIAKAKADRKAAAKPTQDESKAKANEPTPENATA